MNKSIHFSIDDVGASLRWISDNMPESIFDTRLFGKLRTWRQEFGMKVTLYTFCYAREGKVAPLSERYANEIAANSDWIRLGFHGRDAHSPIKAEDFDGFADDWRVCRANMTNILRLHNWFAEDSVKQELLARGVTALLYPDDTPIFSGGFTFRDKGVEYIRTKVRFSRKEDTDISALLDGDSFVAAYTHEWEFDDVTEKIYKMFELCRELGYRFI